MSPNATALTCFELPDSLAAVGPPEARGCAATRCECWLPTTTVFPTGVSPTCQITSMPGIW